MDIKQLWLNVQDLWGTLDQHPLLHPAWLLVLLTVALLLGRVARYLILHASRMLGGNRPCTGSTTCATTRCSIAWRR
jgi:miniconductance mechanosensitive channel